MSNTFVLKLKSLLPTRSNWFGWCSFVLTCAIAIGWLGNTPLNSDDFFYQHMPLFENDLQMWDYMGEAITSFSQVPEAVMNHRANINGRMSNMAYLAVQPLPVWVIKYICGLVLAIFAGLLWRWSERKFLKSNWLAIVVPLLLWTGLQWNDQMESSDFQFNYTLPSAMLVGCLMLFFRNNKKIKWQGWLLLIVFSVWHECFTIALGTFLGVQWLFNRNRKIFIAILILIAGAFFQLSSGTAMRMEENLAESTMLFYPWTQLMSKSWVSILAIGLWIWRRRKMTKEERTTVDRFGLGLLASWIMAMLIIAFVAAPQRAHWPNDVLAVCMVLMIVRTFKPLRINRFISITLLTFYALWGTSLIYWQCKVKDYTYYCLSELRKGKNVILDKGGLAETKFPFWLMGMTKLQYGIYNSWTQWTLAFCGTNRQSLCYALVPREELNKPVSEWKKVPGDNDLFFATSNCLVRLHDGNELAGKYFEVTYSEPTISTPPLDYILALIRGKNKESGLKLRATSPVSMVANGDSVDVIFLEKLPRTYEGRKILKINEAKN